MVYLGKTTIYKFHYGASPDTFQKANELRKNMTEAEKKLWRALRNRQIMKYKFRRQHPISQFMVDFFCPEKGLVIELDGDIHKVVEVNERDLGRTAELERFGLKILRFTNDEVMEELENVIERIKAACK